MSAVKKGAVLSWWLAAAVFVVTSMTSGRALAAPGDAAHSAAATRKAAVIARALAYEQTLRERVGASLVIGVTWDAGNAASVQEAKTWMAAYRALAAVKVDGMSMSAAEVPYSPALGEALTKQGVDVLIVCSGLSAAVQHIAAAAKERRILTVGTSRGDVDAALTMGVFESDDRLRIVINLPVAAGQRIKLSSRLLRLADALR